MKEEEDKKEMKEKEENQISQGEAATRHPTQRPDGGGDSLTKLSRDAKSDVAPSAGIRFRSARPRPRRCPFRLHVLICLFFLLLISILSSYCAFRRRIRVPPPVLSLVLGPVLRHCCASGVSSSSSFFMICLPSCLLYVYFNYFHI